MSIKTSVQIAVDYSVERIKRQEGGNGRSRITNCTESESDWHERRSVGPGNRECGIPIEAVYQPEP